jgi:hypothetical protein
MKDINLIRYFLEKEMVQADYLNQNLLKSLTIQAIEIMKKYEEFVFKFNGFSWQ